MLLRHQSPTRLEFVQRSSVRAPLLAAVGFALLALLPLFGPGRVTLERTVLAALLLLVAGALVAYAWPRTRAVRIELERRVLALDGHEVPLARARCIALTTRGATSEAALRVRYAAELVLDDAARIVLLERSDPAQVLADLRTTVSRLGLPVRTGWGLPDGAEPWRELDEGESAVAPPLLTERARPFEGELGAGICVLGGLIVIGGAIAIMQAARRERGAPISFLSNALAFVLCTLILLLAIFLLTDRVEARIDRQELVLERRAFGLALQVRRVPLGAVRGVYAVGTVPGTPLHLLVDAQGGPLAFPFAGARAEVVARAFASSTRPA